MGNELSAKQDDEDRLSDLMLKETITMCGNLPNKEITQIYKHFQKAYPNGKLTRLEFIRENQNLKGGSEETWSQIYDQIDKDNDGSIDFKEYMVFLSTLNTEKTSKELLEAAFDIMDLDRNGKLDYKELQLMVKLFLRNRSDESRNKFRKIIKDVDQYSKKLFNLMDENKDGEVSFDEFCKICIKQPEICELLTSPLNQLTVLKDDHSLEQIKAETFQDQVGGHGSTQMKKIKKTIIKKDDKLMKPLCQREFEFYEKMEDSKNEIDKKFKEFMPKYYGRQFVEYSNEKEKKKDVVHHIIIQDFTHGMKKPCVMDAKMGTKGHDKSANPKKVIQQKVLCAVSTSSKLGFRLCGLKIYKKPNDNFLKFSKYKAGGLSHKKIDDIFVNFINNGEKIRTGLLKNALIKLRELKKIFQEQKKYNFFSSSILFIYDGMGKKDEMLVKIVDFAHVDEVNQIDSGYLKGLDSLITKFENIVKKYDN